MLLIFKMIKNVYLGWPDLKTSEYLYNQAQQNAWQNGEAKPNSRRPDYSVYYYTVSVNNIHNGLIYYCGCLYYSVNVTTQTATEISQATDRVW